MITKLSKTILINFLLACFLVLTACTGAGAPPPAPWWPTEVRQAAQAVPTQAATPARFPTQASAPTLAPTQAVEPTNPAQPVTLTIWVPGDENYAELLRSATDVYTRAHPKVSFEITPVPWADAHAKFLTVLAAGAAPDIFTGSPAWMNEFGASGGMLDLNTHFPSMAANVKAVTLPQIYDSITTRDGALYGLPTNVDFKLLYYRPDILKELTGSPDAPQTWDELIKTIQRVQSAGRKGLIMQWGNTGWEQFADFLAQAGGSLYDSGCTKATLNSPAGLNALKFYANLYHKYTSPTEIWPDLESGLASGDYPLGISGSWLLSFLDSSRPEISGKWAAAPLPAGPDGNKSTLMMGSAIGITAQSPHPEIAADFLGSLFTDESMSARSAKAAALNYSFIPPGIQFVDSIPLPPEQIQVIKDSLAITQGVPNCPGFEQTAPLLAQHIQDVILNSQDPQQALDAAAEEMNAALK